MARENVVSGIFVNREASQQAMEEVLALGVPQQNISILHSAAPTSDNPPPIEGRSEIGAAIGGGVGLLAGLAAIALPGVGTVIGAGWLTVALGAALTGGIAGGTVGAFVSQGMTEEEAHAYVEALRGGQHIVLVRTESPDQAAEIYKIMRRLGSLDTEAQRAVYRTEGGEFE